MREKESTKKSYPSARRVLRLLYSAAGTFSLQRERGLGANPGAPHGETRGIVDTWVNYREARG
jgi:hypothetical protein